MLWSLFLSLKCEKKCSTSFFQKMLLSERTQTSEILLHASVVSERPRLGSALCGSLRKSSAEPDGATNGQGQRSVPQTQRAHGRGVTAQGALGTTQRGRGGQRPSLIPAKLGCSRALLPLAQPGTRPASARPGAADAHSPAIGPGGPGPLGDACSSRPGGQEVAFLESSQATQLRLAWDHADKRGAPGPLNASIQCLRPGWGVGPALPS